MKFSVNQRVEYSDLSPWEPATIKRITEVGTYIIEFESDGEQLEAYEEALR